jgi:hypothetical protein
VLRPIVLIALLLCSVLCVASHEFQAAALKSKDDGPTQAPGRPLILPETRIGSLFGLIYNSMD